MHVCLDQSDVKRDLQLALLCTFILMTVRFYRLPIYPKPQIALFFIDKIKHTHKESTTEILNNSIRGFIEVCFTKWKGRVNINSGAACTAGDYSLQYTEPTFQSH